MANIHRHITIHGLTDILGDRFLYRKATSQKIVLPRKPKHVDSTTLARRRRSHQDLLREATSYANFAQVHDVYIDKARRTGVTAYNVAFTDWFEGPRLLQIDIDAWTGAAGETIRLKARDNVKVATVSVEIRDAEGNLLEAGEAVQSETDRDWWHYTTRSRIPLKPFPSVEAIARDLPGNQDSLLID